MREAFAQGFAGAVEAGFDGADFDGGDAGDLFERHLFVFEENERLALERRQERDGASDGGGALLMEKAAEGVIGSGKIGGVIGIELAALEAKTLQSEIAGDAQQVGAEGTLGAIEGGAAKQGHEAILGDIFSGFDGAEHAPGKSINGRAVGPIERQEGRFAAAARLIEQDGIGIRHAGLHSIAPLDRKDTVKFRGREGKGAIYSSELMYCVIRGSDQSAPSAIF